MPAKKKQQTVTEQTAEMKAVPAAEAAVEASKVGEIVVAPKKKILFVASEATPFIATGGLAEVIGSLSKALAKNDELDIRVVIPLYSDISWDYRNKFKYLGNIFVPLAWRNQYCGIFSYESDGVVFYFIDNEYYFKRPGCYGYYDDGERFAYFCRSVMEIMPFLNFYPDIMHCHDWQAALASVYLKTIYCFRPEYQYIRSLFTIHNIEYQGKYSLDILEDLFGISNSWKYLLEYNKCINLMKAAIECSEKFSTVSPHYAQEIKEPYYAHGLDPIVRRNEFKLFGILNGIDTDSYNPETDRSVFSHYSAENIEPKKRCKEELQKMFNLPVKPDTPVIAVISRLVAHKGLDLVRAVIEAGRSGHNPRERGFGVRKLFYRFGEALCREVCRRNRVQPRFVSENLFGGRLVPYAVQIGALRPVADDCEPLRRRADCARDGRIIRQYQTGRKRRQRVYVRELQRLRYALCDSRSTQ